jgi:hypothetical protein
MLTLASLNKIPTLIFASPTHTILFLILNTDTPRIYCLPSPPFQHREFKHREEFSPLSLLLSPHLLN